MSTPSKNDIHGAVRDRYAGLATSYKSDSCCPTREPQQSGCCGPGRSADDIAKGLGYSRDELTAVPDGANLGLGCGNPQAIASLRPGEVVLDLGCGAGFDCFLAARAVGTDGRVIGVDMTPEMVEKARSNADKAGVSNVEFRLGMIEDVPVDADSIDVIISNCVINLSPDKPGVYAEAFRVLRSGGRLAISDIVTTATLPDAVRSDMAMYTGCIAGASSIADIEAMLADAGFVDIRIETKDDVRDEVRAWMPGTNIDDYIASATIEAVKP